MNARRVEITLPQELWEELEAQRGHEPRASFIKRALESALGSEPGGAVRTADARPEPHPAPTRAPEHMQVHKDFAEARNLPPGVEKGTAKVKSGPPSVASTWRR